MNACFRHFVFPARGFNKAIDQLSFAIEVPFVDTQIIKNVLGRPQTVEALEAAASEAGSLARRVGSGLHLFEDTSGRHLPGVDFGPQQMQQLMNKEDIVKGTLTHAQLTPSELPPGVTALPTFSTRSISKDVDLFVPSIRLVSSESYEAKLFAAVKDSTANVYLGDHLKGTSFMISDDLMGTANHVTFYADKTYTVKLAGRDVTARVVGRDRAADMAILKLEDVHDAPPPLQFMPLNKLEIGDLTHTIGRPNGTLVISEGRLSRFNQYAAAPASGDQLEYGERGSVAAFDYLNEGFGGMSGAPVMMENKVAAIHTNGRNQLSLTTGISAEHMKAVLNQVEARRPFVGWLDVKTRANFSKTGKGDDYLENVDVSKDVLHNQTSPPVN